MPFAKWDIYEVKDVTKIPTQQTSTSHMYVILSDGIKLNAISYTTFTSISSTVTNPDRFSVKLSPGDVTVAPGQHGLSQMSSYVLVGLVGTVPLNYLGARVGSITSQHTRDLILDALADYLAIPNGLPTSAPPTPKSKIVKK